MNRVAGLGVGWLVLYAVCWFGLGSVCWFEQEELVELCEASDGIEVVGKEVAVGYVVGGDVEGRVVAAACRFCVGVDE